MTEEMVKIKIDKSLKKQAEELFKSLGMTLNEAIVLFLEQSVREKKMPFEIIEIPNKETLAAFAEVEEMKKHPEKYKVYDNLDELFRDLKS